MKLSKKELHRYQEKMFDLFFIAMYLLMVLSSLGLSESAREWMSTMNVYFRIYICLFLIWRFNPLRSRYEFTNLDRKISFSAGVFILTTTFLNEYFEQLKQILNIN